MNESFELHKQLNQKIFDGDTLKSDVREKILEVVDEFVDNLWIRIDPLDIYLLGSNASYTYTDKSDLDIHLIVNFDTLEASNDILNALYNLEKASFNKNYDIKIKGIPVELYVEDVNSNAVSNGVYSVLNNKWIKYPNEITDMPQYEIDSQLNKWSSRINRALEKGSKEDIKQIIDALYMIRKNSILVDGEFGKGNYLFKEIRNLGLLDAMKDKLKELTSDELSLESLI